MMRCSRSQASTAGNQIGSRDVLVGESSDNWLTLRASGMHSFAIVSNWPPSPFGVQNSPDYAIEAIEFHPVPAVPEPGSLTLFAMGSLVLAGRVWARHNRRTSGG